MDRASEGRGRPTVKRIDEQSHKLHPRLRVIRNGDQDVNAILATLSQTVASAMPLQADERPVAEVLQRSLGETLNYAAGPTQRPLRRLSKRAKLADRPASTEAYVNVFLEFHRELPGWSSADLERAIAGLRAQVASSVEHAPDLAAGTPLKRRNFMSATVPVAMLDEVSANPVVAFVHQAESLKLSVPQAEPALRKPQPRAIGTARRHGRGKGVLIGIVDVDGFDFAHADFLRPDGTTRFVAIWDQGGDFRPPPAPFGYGAHFTEANLNAAIRAARLPGLPPATMIELQSQRQPGSHGTHVASIAAGNTGVCPEAEIAAVLIDVPKIDDPIERLRTTFSDSSRITHAVEYLLQVANGRPVVINISLGTNGGAHDGSSGVSRWLDAYLGSPGRVICVAAGNAGQEAAESEDDIGWIMGRIHTSGRIPSRGLEQVIEWTVVGNGIEDVSDNELEIWYGPQDRFIVSLQPPGSMEWITVKPREYVENVRLPSGTTVSIYNELYHPTNGANYIAIYLTPNRERDNFRGIQPGVWRVRLEGDEIRDGRFHAWIERDDPGEVGRAGSRRFFRFPSFFSQRSNVDSHSIGSLACGHRVIAVSNLDVARQRIAASSSQGPTRDERQKPEIAAPGTDIVAANGFAESNDEWISMSGTSMASPYVAGVVGLMLGANPAITAAQCAGILQRTARPLAGASYDWVNHAGFGRIDPEAAVEEARAANQRTKLR
jgi:subtilisin family serine protease